jgi:antitoxin component of RelBE/YafQ-DinJ toxin-antitoxin module
MEIMSWRTDEELKESLNQIAAENGWTLSRTMRVLLREALKHRADGVEEQEDD